VPIDPDGQPRFMMEDWEYKFSTDEAVFFKCTEVDGNNFGGISDDRIGWVLWGYIYSHCW
jgi:hypothetical protein